MNLPSTLGITATVQIGNSDDKLTQSEWSAFQSAAWATIQLWAGVIHFEGHSAPMVSWQNACWVFEIQDANLTHLRGALANVARRYRQDSIALTLGVTEFVTPP